MKPLSLVSLVSGPTRNNFIVQPDASCRGVRRARSSICLDFSFEEKEPKLSLCIHRVVWM